MTDFSLTSFLSPFLNPHNIQDPQSVVVKSSTIELLCKKLSWAWTWHQFLNVTKLSPISHVLCTPVLHSPLNHFPHPRLKNLEGAILHFDLFWTSSNLFHRNTVDLCNGKIMVSFILRSIIFLKVFWPPVLVPNWQHTVHGQTYVPEYNFLFQLKSFHVPLHLPEWEF